MKRTRFKWKPRSRRTKSRTILYGKKYGELRWLKACGAQERCEHCGAFAPYEGNTLSVGQLAHKQRGAKRNSTPEETLWLCRPCHDRFDNRNQKVVPPKGVTYTEGVTQ